MQNTSSDKVIGSEYKDNRCVWVALCPNDHPSSPFGVERHLSMELVYLNHIAR